MSNFKCILNLHRLISNYYSTLGFDKNEKKTLTVNK